MAKYLDYNGLENFWKHIEQQYQTDVAIECSGTAEVTDLYHWGQKTKYGSWTKDSDATNTPDSFYTLYIDSSVTIIKLNGQTIKCVAPQGSQTFKNGKRIVLMGTYTLLPNYATSGTAQTGGGNGDYILDPYLYHRMAFLRNDNDDITAAVNINNGPIQDTPYQGVNHNTTISSLQSQTNVGTPQKFEEFIYWNKRWYSKGYIVFPTASGVSSSNYLPVTADAVYSYCQQFASSSDIVDEKVWQVASTAASRRKLLLTYNSTSGAGGTGTAITDNKTGQVYYSNSIEADASDGSLFAKYFITKNGNVLLRDGNGGTYNRVALSTDGIFMKDAAHKSSVEINSTGSIWAKVNLKARLLQLAPAEGEGPAYLDFYRPGDTDPSGRFICRTQNSIVLENCNFYSSKYKALAGDTYALTTTDGVAGVCGSGTLVLPSLTDTDAYTNASLIGRNIWVDGNQGVITVNFTSSTGSASITVGGGQGAMFVMNHSHTWDLLTPGFLVKKTVSGSQTYTLTQTDGLGLIAGTSTNTTAIKLPLSAGWEGRRVMVAAYGGALPVQHYYRKDDGNTTSTTKSITSGSFTEYVFIDGAWHRTAGKSL